MLYAFREGDANMRSVWLCSRNDAIGNVAVMLAALGVFGTGTAWPDLAVAAVMAALALSGGWSVLRQARGELRHTSRRAKRAWPRRRRFHNRRRCPDQPSSPSSSPAPRAGAITDVAGIEVGHFSDPRRPTGCTVILAREGAVAGVDVRGAAPGTRETDLLAPGNFVQQVHAVMLAGGSAWGLAAADGAMRWLEERGIGLDVRYGTLPIVPAAVLFDLPLGDARIRPDAAAGYAACEAASTRCAGRGQRGRRQRRAGGQAVRRATAR